MCIWWWNLGQISLRWCWCSNPPLLDGVQHLSRHETYKHTTKKAFLWAPLKQDGHEQHLDSSVFLSALLPHGHGLHTTRSTRSTHSAIHTPSGDQLSALPRGLTSSLGQETEKKSEIFFQGGGMASSLLSAILFPLTSATLSCHPQLQAGTKCTVYYTYTQRQGVCTHEPSLPSSLTADCIRKCSQAWNGSFDAFSSDVPCMKQLLALAPE